MKKRLVKKLICIVLACQMLLGMSVTAFAEEVLQQPEVPTGDTQAIESLDLLTQTPTEKLNGYEDILFNGKNAGGEPITLWNGEAAVEYNSGIGMHAFDDTTLAKVSYDISGFNHNVFRAMVGVDYNSDSTLEDRGTCEFKVLLDGKEVFSSGVLRASDAATQIAALIPEGTKTLTLAVSNGGDGDTCDWANWVSSRLESDPDAPLELWKITAEIDKQSLRADETAQLAVTGLHLDGTEIQDILSHCTFTSDDNSVATVSNTGLLTALSAGKTKIAVTATLNGIKKTATAAVTVLPSLADSHVVTSPSGSIKLQMLDMGEGTWKYMTYRDEEVVIALSPLGLVTSLGDFTGGLTFQEA